MILYCVMVLLCYVMLYDHCYPGSRFNCEESLESELQALAGDAEGTASAQGEDFAASLRRRIQEATAFHTQYHTHLSYTHIYI